MTAPDNAGGAGTTPKPRPEDPAPPPVPKPGLVDQEGYDSEYYAHGFGPPYRRGEAHWKEFFGTMADAIVRHIAPATAFDAGCAIGLLVEELRERGVDATGMDFSEWAIDQVPPELAPYCTLGSIVDELDRDVDLITCIEVLEHLIPHQAEDAVANLCRHAKAILFSSTPDVYDDPTHLNVHDSDYWIGLFAEHGFFRDLDHDASYIATHAVLLRPRVWSTVDVAKHYERAWWQAHRTDRASRQRSEGLETELDGTRAALAQLEAEQERLRTELIGASAYVDGVNAERDRLQSLLAVNEGRLAAVLRESDGQGPTNAQSLLEERTRELEALRSTRLFRYTRHARRLYGRLRQTRRATPPRGARRAGVPAAEEPPHGAEPRATSYADWILEYDNPAPSGVEPAGGRAADPGDWPLISVVMPVFDPDERHLRAAVGSVMNQTYPKWELCIADDASTLEWVPRVLAEYAAADTRVKVVTRESNGNISAASNSALALATGSFIGFLDHDDELAPRALAEVATAVRQHEDVGVLYSDEDKIDEIGNRSDPYFKPEWDPLLLTGQNYLTHFFVARRDLVDDAGGLREGYEGAQDWDLAFRVTERVAASQIIRIPRILYHWRLHPRSTAASQSAKPYAAAAARRATRDHLDRTGRAGRVVPLGRIGYQRVEWARREPAPLVSIIIPTKDGQMLSRCLESLWYRVTYPEYEVIVVDNGSTSPTVLQYLADHADKVRIVRDDRPFNYSALNNSAARVARGSVLCLLNDDIEIGTGDWLEEMVSQLEQPDVGVVGAKLLYPNGQIQHAGVVLGIGGVAAHGFRYFDSLFFGHFGHAILPRTPSAVTGACLATRREVWEQLNGLDELHLPVSYNDVDYCLRAREAGWKTVWTPFAELVHHESVSRGPDTDPANQARAREEYEFMMQRWGSTLRRDPAYNPNLTLDTEDYALSFPPRREP